MMFSSFYWIYSNIVLVSPNIFQRILKSSQPRYPGYGSYDWSDVLRFAPRYRLDFFEAMEAFWKGCECEGGRPCPRSGFFRPLLPKNGKIMETLQSTMGYSWWYCKIYQNIVNGKKLGDLPVLGDLGDAHQLGIDICK